MYFINIDKLVDFNNLNYALLREAIKDITKNSNMFNNMLHITIDNRWRYILRFLPKYR